MAKNRKSQENTPSPRKKRAFRILGTVLGLAIIIGMFVHYGTEAVLHPLLHSDPFLLVILLLLGVVQQSLNAVALVALMAPLRPRTTTFFDTARTFLAVQPLALIVPGKFSDFAAVPLLKEHYKSGAVTGAVIMDRLVTVFVLVGLTPPAALYLVGDSEFYTLAFGSLVLLCALGVIPFLLLHPRVRRLVNRTALRRWPGLLEGFGDHIALLVRADRWRILLSAFLRIVKLLLSAVALSLLARNIDLTVQFVDACVMSVLMQAATLIPISAMGLGVTEASLAVLFSLLTLPPAAALSIMIVGRPLQLLVFLGIYLTTTLPILARDAPVRQLSRTDA